MDIDSLLKNAKSSMQKSVEHTSQELSKIRAGKALPSMLDGLMVSYYGTPTPIGQVASITSADARTLAIKPWEKNMIAEIEKAIKTSDLGVNPQNDGELVRISFPPLTEERRKNLVKQVKSEIENGKVKIRGIRKDTNESIKKLTKEGVAEDLVKKGETKVQDMTDDFIKKLDELALAKEKDIMTV